MGKQSGLGDLLLMGGFDFSGDIGQVNSIHGGPAAMDVTGINKSAHERIGGKRDGGIVFSAFHNDAAGQAFTRLSPLPTGDVMVSYLRGQALGARAAAIMAKQINFDPTRALDGMLTYAVDTVGNGFGLEWGYSLCAGKRTDVAATNGTGVDATDTSPGAASTFGAQFYLQVTAFTGTNVTITVQDSPDNTTFTTVTGGTFTLVTGVTTERLQTSGAQTVNRYLRVITTGTFTSVTFNVIAVRNYITPAF